MLRTCLLPWNGVWYDSAFPLNNVTFDGGSQTVSGWKIRVYNTEGTNWHCLEEAGNTLLFKSTPGFESVVFGLPNLYVYRCIQWSKLSDDVYQYYVIGDEQSNIGNQRLYVDIRDINATIATACSASSPPSTAEFHILVKAANGLFYCVHSVTVGNAQYVITINPEIVNYIRTFKFTCFTHARHSHHRSGGASSAILLTIIIVIILYCCCCKKSIKRKLLFGQQTAESRETDDKLPLTETVDNEKHSSDAINPETHSQSTTTSSKQKSKKEKSPVQDGKQSISIIQITSPYSEGKTASKEDLTPKGRNGDTANKIGSLNDDDDKIEIDYEKYLEDSKKSKKPNKSGKVVFLEEIEESHVSSVITPKNEENLDRTNSMKLEHIQRFNKIDGIISTDTTGSESVQNDNESEFNDVQQLTHGDQLVQSLVGETEKLTEELEKRAESSKIKTANRTDLETPETLSKVPNSKPDSKVPNSNQTQKSRFRTRLKSPEFQTRL
uniref:Uncharacterized protein LOC111124223 n=1 Tax=Crassostrea virginica TaxID=6565 RepID=A0A8B8D544_CRAVI|nr:uncharacterized protein LOC111124223 [Crassostrea virginica]